MRRSVSPKVVVLAALSRILVPALVTGHEPLPSPPAADTRCPVCGMLVAPHPAWTAQLVFSDGSRAYFDGSKDLFRYLLARDRYLPDKKHLDVEAVFVTDYYELRPVSARSAFFVVGGDIRGPMGAELVPHTTRQAADEFLADHGGLTVVTFDEVTTDLLRGLR